MYLGISNTKKQAESCEQQGRSIDSNLSDLTILRFSTELVLSEFCLLQFINDTNAKQKHKKQTSLSIFIINLIVSVFLFESKSGNYKILFNQFIQSDEIHIQTFSCG